MSESRSGSIDLTLRYDDKRSHHDHRHSFDGESIPAGTQTGSDRLHRRLYIRRLLAFIQKKGTRRQAIYVMSLLVSQPILLTVGLVANSVVIGAPVWVFFVQSPALFAFMGREKFLPPMMRLTKVLFRWTLPVASGVVVLSEMLRQDGTILEKNSTKFACLSLLAVLVNSLLIVPKALAAGAKATMKKNDDNKSTGAVDIAISGGDAAKKSGTKILHQTVVVFVTAMLAGSVGYVHCVVNNQ